MTEWMEMTRNTNAQLESVLNPTSNKITLATMQKTANAVGKSLRMELV